MKGLYNLTVNDFGCHGLELATFHLFIFWFLKSPVSLTN